MKATTAVVLILYCLTASLLSTTTAFAPTPKQAFRIQSFLRAVPDADKRKAEIEQKIAQFKREGKLKPQIEEEPDEELDLESMSDVDQLRVQRQKMKKKGSAVDQYSSALQDRLGRRARYLGVDTKATKRRKAAAEDTPKREAKLGALDYEDDDAPSLTPVSSTENTDFKILNPDLFQDDDEDDEAEFFDEDGLDEEALVDLVAEKLRQKRALEKEAQEERFQAKKMELKQEREANEAAAAKTPERTTGIGGAYKKNETAIEDKRRPSRGSWGYFERPNDISKAYGGGRRVGAGYMKAEDKEADYERTKQRMKEYRIKMGIDVQEEKDHAAEISEAMTIAKRAMERGVYNTAVSALEKVSGWCSSNSPVGSEVFLELAMAYEAVGKAEMARQVYQKLSKCRVEDVKNNAKKLLYGLESFEFMKKDAQLASFNRKKVRNTFIDTTRMDQFASNFDNVYNTAYVDTSSSKYKKLTANVVRSVREARQILLQATSGKSIDRTKVIQALRSVARRFDEALRDEKKAVKQASEPVPMMDGMPIVVTTKKDDTAVVEFTLSSPEQMLENLSGEWRLAIIADKTGSGVRFFDNSTVTWQQVDAEGTTFTSETAGFLKASESGNVEFEAENRILKKTGIQAGGFASLLGPQVGAASNRVAQQIMTVDSVLLVTRCAELKRFQDEDKEHFAVWRKVEDGAYSSSS